MLDLSKIAFEQKSEYRHSAYYYFVYDDTDPKSVSDKFSSKEYYENKYGEILHMTINIEVSTEDLNHPLLFIFRASPTCNVQGWGPSDVDWGDIDILDADEDTVKGLLKIAGAL